MSDCNPWRRRLIAALLCLPLLLLAGTPAEAGGLLGGSSSAAPVRCVLRCTPNADVPRLVRRLNSLGLRVVTRHGPARLLVIEPTSLLRTLTGTLSLVSGLPGVQVVEEDFLLASSDPYGGHQSQHAAFDWEFSAASMPTQPAMQMIGLDPRPAAPIDQVTVLAILDGGFDLEHEALQGCVDGRFDALDPDGDAHDPGNGVDDDGDGHVDEGLGHGSAVAALARAANPDVRLLCARVLDDEGGGTVSSIAAGLDWALRSGADVVNISAGSARSSWVLDRLLAEAHEAGVLVVASAGNDGKDDVLFPGNSPHTLAVSSVGLDAGLAAHANFGRDLDLTAPGVDLVAPIAGTGNGYGRWTGTSFATGLVSGALTLVLQAEPGPATDRVAILLDALAAYAQQEGYDLEKLGDGILDLAPVFAP